MHRSNGEPADPAGATRRSPVVTWILRLAAVWFVVYFGTGIVAMQRQSTGFFAATVDRVESTWIRLVLLNLPLQLGLAGITLALVSIDARAARRAAHVTAVALAATIGTHVVLSFTA